MLITNSESEDSLGVISVLRTQEDNIDEICDKYIIGDGEKDKTVISDNLIFVDFSNEVNSKIIGRYAVKMYCFIFYDQKTSTVLYGRFFENNDRDDVIILAKSIKIEKYNIIRSKSYLNLFGSLSIVGVKKLKWKTEKQLRIKQLLVCY